MTQPAAEAARIAFQSLSIFSQNPQNRINLLFKGKIAVDRSTVRSIACGIVQMAPGVKEWMKGSGALKGKGEKLLKSLPGTAGFPKGGIKGIMGVDKMAGTDDKIKFRAKILMKFFQVPADVKLQPQFDADIDADFIPVFFFKSVQGGQIRGKIQLKVILTEG